MTHTPNCVFKNNIVHPYLYPCDCAGQPKVVHLPTCASKVKSASLYKNSNGETLQAVFPCDCQPPQSEKKGKEKKHCENCWVTEDGFGQCNLDDCECHSSPQSDWKKIAMNWKDEIESIKAIDFRTSGVYYWSSFATKKMIETIIKYEPNLRIIEINGESI